MKTKGIILFGDSVFFGYGASDKNKGCGRILRNLCRNVQILIKARNNDSTRSGLDRIKGDVLTRENYSHVFILFGNNDCRLVDKLTPICTIEEFRNNLMKITLLIKNVGKNPILCNLQPINDYLCYQRLSYMREYLNPNITPDAWHKKYSDEIVLLADKIEVPIVDIEKKLRSTSDAIYKDGLHPNDKGHMVIARLLFDEIKKQGLA